MKVEQKQLDVIKTEVFRDRNGHELQALKQKHLDIMRLWVEGFKQVEIAERLGLSLPTVAYTLNSQMVKERIAVLNGMMEEQTLEVKQRLEHGNRIALDVTMEIMTDMEAKRSDRLKAALGWLDRGGHMPRREGGGGGRVRSMTELKERLLKYKEQREGQEVVERTFTQVIEEED